jgi:hypothetical protein
VQWIEEQLRGLSLDAAAAAPGPIAPGALVVGKYSLDNNWYRAYVEKVGGGRGGRSGVGWGWG